MTIRRHAANGALFALSASVTLLLTTATFPTGSGLPDGAAKAAAPTYIWSPDAVRGLYAEMLASEREGLDPAAYEPAAFAALASQGQSDALDSEATRLALALAQDYAFGRVDQRARVDWHIARDDIDARDLIFGLEAAIAEQRVRPWLRSLLPGDARYAGLRDVFAATPATDRVARNRIRANLERWRWMPREIGSDYVFVNVPAYRLDLFDEGQPVSSHDVIVGKPSTPTPQLAVPALSLVVNPWWTIPWSIARKMGRPGPGYVVSGGKIRQPPGPRNALGKIKLDMPNPYLIYLHDTPSKGLFAARARAFSNGCIRVKDMARLSADLLEMDRADSTPLDRALARSATRTVSFERLRPVYLVYFTAEADPEGQIAVHDDPYGRDARVIAALDRHG